MASHYQTFIDAFPNNFAEVFHKLLDHGYIDYNYSRPTLTKKGKDYLRYEHNTFFIELIPERLPALKVLLLTLD